MLPPQNFSSPLIGRLVLTPVEDLSTVNVPNFNQLNVNSLRRNSLILLQTPTMGSSDTATFVFQSTKSDIQPTLSQANSVVSDNIEATSQMSDARTAEVCDEQKKCEVFV